MANYSINSVLHHHPMLLHDPVASPLRPVKVFTSFHSFPSSCTVNHRSLHVSTARWCCSASSCSSRCCFRLRGCKWKQVVRSCSITDIVIASDESYGNKQVVSLTPRLYGYVLKNVREPEILRQLREETASMRGSQMQVSPDQAQLLAMLVQILGAERCIEVGVYTGYSSLAIALVLPESGRLVARERDPKSLDVAKKYYQLAGVSHKVDVKLGLAEDSLESLILNGEAGSYDFAFIDAEKRMTQKYFELLLQLVRVGGVIVIDNVLWHGKVADPLVSDSKTISIRNFNQQLMEDKRVSISMVPIGDGMTICRKI
uniref:Caffeoyl-CoA O-methyltransferase n=1 Tax=Lotus japonicus TaxID=34305 RepID=I3T910_LOTJA|nr:unknown [Lotus japonicus]